MEGKKRWVINFLKRDKDQLITMVQLSDFNGILSDYNLTGKSSTHKEPWDKKHKDEEQGLVI